MPEDSTTNSTFATEVEQYTYDQSIANSENAGMLTSVFVNVIILAAVIAGIVFFARKKTHKG